MRTFSLILLLLLSFETLSWGESRSNRGFPWRRSDEKSLIFSEKQAFKVDSMMNSCIEQKFFPGGQIVVGGKKGVYYSNSYGFLDYSNSEVVTDSSLYDLASLTKVFATTLAAMRLVDERKLNLSSTIGSILPVYNKTPFSSVTVEELLAHTSGFEPVVWIAGRLVSSCSEKVEYTTRKKSKTNPYMFGEYAYIAKDIKFDSQYISNKKESDNYAISADLYLKHSFEAVVDSMVVEAYNPLERKKLKYSDLNYYMLQKVIKKVAQKELHEVVAPIYTSVGAENIGFSPLLWSRKENIAPTEYNVAFRRDTLRGYVHDDMAAAMGLECGHAGLFASALSLSPICEMFLCEGSFEKQRVISAKVLSNFTHAREYKTGGVRGLGFDKQNPKTSSYGGKGYGHSGYTGTYFWVDPEEEFYLIILTNRVCPTRTNSTFSPKVRQDIWCQIKELLE